METTELKTGDYVRVTLKHCDDYNEVGFVTSSPNWRRQYLIKFNGYVDYYSDVDLKKLTDEEVMIYKLSN